MTEKTDDEPAISELRRRAGTAFAASASLSATIEIAAPDVPVRSVRVWYRRPGQWRIEDDDGLLVLHTRQQHVARSPDGRLLSLPRERVWVPEGEIGFLGWGSAQVFLGAKPVPLTEAEVALADTEIAGRAVQVVAVQWPGKRCRVLLEAASGLPLAQTTRVTHRSMSGEFSATVIELRHDVDLPEELFAARPVAEFGGVDRLAPTQVELWAGGPSEDRNGLTEDWNDSTEAQFGPWWVRVAQSAVGADRPLVVAAVLRDRDQVLLCHRSPQRSWFPNVWDLPGGHVEVGETPAQALVRELGEELGIAVPEPETGPLAVFDTAEFVLLIWVVDAWQGTVGNAAPAEHDELAWLTAEDLRDDRPMADARYRELLTGVLAD